MDVRLHKRHPYNRNLASGGCTEWSVKGIASECHIGRDKVVEALKQLLDAGFIQYAGRVPANGSMKRKWRVTHPDELEAVRYSIDVMGLPSLRWDEKAAAAADEEADRDAEEEAMNDVLEACL
jgi:asparagine synthetase B (glutamine-hydrolysing)